MVCKLQSLRTWGFKFCRFSLGSRGSGPAVGPRAASRTRHEKRGKPTGRPNNYETIVNRGLRIGTRTLICLYPCCLVCNAYAQRPQYCTSVHSWASLIPCTKASEAPAKGRNWSSMNFPNREELSFRKVLAFPKACSVTLQLQVLRSSGILNPYSIWGAPASQCKHATCSLNSFKLLLGEVGCCVYR